MSEEKIDHGLLSPMGEYHPWFRTLHRLLDLGKPLGRVTLLSIHPGGGSGFALAAMQRTDAGRLIFWQPLPRGYEEQVGVQDRRDHLSLELAKSKTHVTSPRTTNVEATHEPKGRLEQLSDSSLRYWFSLLVRWHVLEKYPVQLERTIRWPTSDAERRKSELVKALANTSQERVVTPGRDPQGDYALVAFLLAGSDNESGLSTGICSMILARLASDISGLPDDVLVPFAQKRLVVGDTKLVLAAASPPGNLRPEILIKGPVN